MCAIKYYRSLFFKTHNLLLNNFKNIYVYEYIYTCIYIYNKNIDNIFIFKINYIINYHISVTFAVRDIFSMTTKSSIINLLSKTHKENRFIAPLKCARLCHLLHP